MAQMFTNDTNRKCKCLMEHLLNHVGIFIDVYG